MIWTNGLTKSAKRKILMGKKESWHLWFAWRPVIFSYTPDNHEVKVWLQTVLRKGFFFGDGQGWCWDYKIREKHD